MKSSNYIMEAKRKQYEKILREINNQEVVDFLMENLLLDSKLENRFKMKFNKYFSKKTKIEIKEMFKKEWLKISDRGYISEEMGFEAMHILYNYTQIINELIE